MSSAKHQTYNPYHQPNPDQILSLHSGLEEDKQKKPIVRRTVDYHTTIINYLETRAYFRNFREFKHIYPTSNAIRHMRPIPLEKDNESHGFCTKYVSTSINKHKCAINCLIWSPEGRRLITGNAMGQFTLWNGLKFNFDTILPAHEYPIRRMMWKFDDEILVSSDSRGYIKYWTHNMKNLLSTKGHDESVNDMCFSPSYNKFATASADGYLKVWDFASCKPETATRGHGWDVTCVDWHPSKSIIASGSKDNLIKIWCPRSGECLRSMHGHKNTVSAVRINRINGNWLLSGSKDQLIKVWDLRMLGKGEYDTIRAEMDELSCISWHPHYEKLFVAGGKSGDIKYFVVGNSGHHSGGKSGDSNSLAPKNYQAEIHKAHEQIIWDFAWHPLGHILASSSNDQTTRFWTRNRPGDDMNDQYNVNQLTGDSKKAALRQLAIATKHNPLGTGRTSKPLTEIGGVNLEEIINIEDNADANAAAAAGANANRNERNDRGRRDGNKFGRRQDNKRVREPHRVVDVGSGSGIHPERMRQMGGGGGGRGGGRQNRLPGMPAMMPQGNARRRPPHGPGPRPPGPYMQPPGPHGPPGPPGPPPGHGRPPMGPPPYGMGPPPMGGPPVGPHGRPPVHYAGPPVQRPVGGPVGGPPPHGMHGGYGPPPGPPHGGHVMRGPGPPPGGHGPPQGMVAPGPPRGMGGPPPPQGPYRGHMGGPMGGPPGPRPGPPTGPRQGPPPMMGGAGRFERERGPRRDQDRQRERSRSRSRERKPKTGSTVPGLSRIFGK